MNLAWHDIVGGIGVAMIITAYALLQAGRLPSERLAYSALNGAGALLVLVSLWYSFNLPSFIIESFWLVISIYGLAKGLRRPREG